MKCGCCQYRRSDPNWLYVVAARDGDYPVKVGISRRVGSRVATHRKKEKRSDLYVASRIEFCCEYTAGLAETAALNELRQSCINVKGDWVDCPLAVAVDATRRAGADA